MNSEEMDVAKLLGQPVPTEAHLLSLCSHGVSHLLARVWLLAGVTGSVVVRSRCLRSSTGLGGALSATPPPPPPPPEQGRAAVCPGDRATPTHGGPADGSMGL